MYDFPFLLIKVRSDEALYVAVITCFVLAAIMFALLIVRIEMGSSTSEDVLHQIAVRLLLLCHAGPRSRWTAVEGNDPRSPSVSDSKYSGGVLAIAC